MDHHRQGRVYRAQQPRRVWHEPSQPVSAAVSVGIMGLGQLGGAAASQLLSIGLQGPMVWSRTTVPWKA